jgi:hypothetical protein
MAELQTASDRTRERAESRAVVLAGSAAPVMNPIQAVQRLPLSPPRPRTEPEEQREIIRDRSPEGGRYSSLLNRAVEMGVSRDEVVRFAAGLRIDLPSQMRFLDGAVSPWWQSIDYVQIQPMVRAAPGDRTSLRTNRWRQVFVDVCDDTTIVTAVTDLGIDADTRQAWIAEERSWF